LLPGLAGHFPFRKIISQNYISPYKMSLLSTVSAYPGTKPVTSPFFMIQNKFDILSDFQNDWNAHMHWTDETVERAMRALSGIAGNADYASVIDYYFTNRFDIASHYVRAFDLSQKLPLTSVNDITSVVGQRLVVLLDQHIKIALVVSVVKLEGAKLMPAGSAAGFAVKQGLLANAGQYAQYDPIADVLANGKAIVSLIANVSRSISQGTPPQQKGNAIVAFDQSAYDGFNSYIASSPYFQSTKGMVSKSLSRAGIPSMGAAQDVWNSHLAMVVFLITSELAFDVATKAGTIDPNDPNLPPAVIGADTAMIFHATSVAALFAASLGVTADGKSRMAYPAVGTIPDNSTDVM
jgi:hypothetical protein